MATETEAPRVIVSGHVMVYYDDGGGWVPFETELGEHTSLEFEEIHIKDLEDTGEPDIFIDEIKTVPQDG